MQGVIDMEAGPELDAEVAHTVLRMVPCDQWEVFRHGGLNGPEFIQTSKCAHVLCYPAGNVARYSKSMAAAWSVAEYLHSLMMQVTVRSNRGRASCEVVRGILRIAYVETEKAPHAICLAALRAVET